MQHRVLLTDLTFKQSDRDVWYTEDRAILATMIARIRAVDGGSGTACAGPVIGI